MLEVVHVTKRYRKVLANDDINLTIEDGRIGVLLGPNGAGKSTIIKCIMGFLKYQGQIQVNGLENKSIEAKKIMGYIPEIPSLYPNLTVDEHMEFIARAYKLKDYKAYKDALLERFDLTDKKEKFGDELSKGMQQKLSICCGLLPKPRLVLFDEPMIGLDPHAIKELFATERVGENAELRARIAGLTEADYTRLPAFAEREAIQKDAFKLPLLPTTTIGSFPQTKEVRAKRLAFRKNELSQEEYDAFLAEITDEWIKWQEEVGFDVLVHGEFERNDMVEYFGQNLSGYLFSKNGWVQSYGMRGVKPPIIWGDVTRLNPITVKWSSYAQSRTDKPVKGMLTGPVTILNWSFPREDISIKDSTLQIALAIKDEVLDLEAAGVKIIQIDEAALREKLPLRRSDWYEDYLDWAIPAFRLVHSTVAPDTQIHTHMCYSEFTDIIPAIDNLDADVISFEASRSNLEILDELKAQNFQTEVGPGVYDIHSPRVPQDGEIDHTIEAILAKVPSGKVWINPDCGLKTRGIKETKESLIKLVEAAKAARENL